MPNFSFKFVWSASVWNYCFLLCISPLNWRVLYYLVFSHHESTHTVIKPLLNLLFDKRNRLSILSLLLESISSDYNCNFLKAFLEILSATSSFFQYSSENVNARALSNSPLEVSPMPFAKEKSYYSKFLFPSLLIQEPHLSPFLY